MRQGFHEPVPEGMLVTGIIRSPHGLEGFVKIESISGETVHFDGLADVLVRTSGGPPVCLEIEAVRANARPPLVKFRGVDSPEAAKRFTGAEILVSRDNACPLDADEFYVSDLCQCMLVHNDVSVGLITGVLEGGESDLLEVTLSDGAVPGIPGGEKRFVPFRKEFVGEVDMKAKTVALMHRWILE